jgi:serine/threonine protein kinase
LTLIPMLSVDPDERQRFQEKARTAMLLDHVNIAKTVAFGTAGDSYVYVSEYPAGETLQEWVTANGPLPAEAVLRVGLQVVAALAAASFHGLCHPAIQPANLVIVSGKTAEGGWPFVKLTHFALSGLKSAPGHGDPDVNASDFASPEQLLQGKVDFRSEIYSLGATMCFLLTGVFYSAYPRSPQTKRFIRPLRTLIARTLEDDPEVRPHDPVLFTEELRTCLVAIGRRQSLQQRFGIPFAPVARPPRSKKRRSREARPTPLLATIGQKPAEPEIAPRRSRFRPVWALAACLLALGIVAALFLPEDVVTAALHRNKSPKSIGVPVGIPDNASAPTVASVSTPPATSAAVSSPATTTPAVATETQANPVSFNGSTSSPRPNDRALPSPNPATIAEQTVVAPDNRATHSQSVATTPAAANSPAVTMFAANSEGPPNSATQQNAASAAPARHSESAPSESKASSPQPRPALVAANNIEAEAAPPAEAPNEAATEPQTDVDRNENSSDEAASDSNDESREITPRSDEPQRSRTQKTRTKKAAPASPQNRSRLAHPRVPRALPAEPDGPPNQPGTIRARVVGITPNGNVILVLPSGERAIVAPQDADRYSPTENTRRRARRVIIERRAIYPRAQPVSPYQPFVPPDA